MRDTLGMTHSYLRADVLSIRQHERALSIREAKLGPDHPQTLTSRNNLAETYRAAGRTDEALKLHEATLKASEAKLGPDHPDTLITRHNLADAYESAGRFAQSEPLRRLNLDRASKRFGPADRRTASALVGLGSTLLKQEKDAEAEPILRDCLAIREKARPDDWSTFNTRSMLGGALLGQKKYAEAEPLLVSGYEGMKAREAKIPAPAKVRLVEAVERLVKLYEGRGQPAKAAEWRARLPKPRP